MAHIFQIINRYGFIILSHKSYSIWIHMIHQNLVKFVTKQIYFSHTNATNHFLYLNWIRSWFPTIYNTKTLTINLQNSIRSVYPIYIAERLLSHRILSPFPYPNIVFIMIKINKTPLIEFCGGSERLRSSISVGIKWIWGFKLDCNERHKRHIWPPGRDEI